MTFAPGAADNAPTLWHVFRRTRLNAIVTGLSTSQIFTTRISIHGATEPLSHVRQQSTSTVAKATRPIQKKPPPTQFPPRLHAKSTPSAPSSKPQTQRPRMSGDVQPLSPTLSSIPTSSDKIYVLSHFKRPPPMMVRGLQYRALNFGQKIIQKIQNLLYGKRPAVVYTPHNIPRLPGPMPHRKRFRLIMDGLAAAGVLLVVYGLTWCGKWYKRRAATSSSEGSLENSDSPESAISASIGVEINEPGLVEIPIQARLSR